MKSIITTLGLVALIIPNNLNAKPTTDHQLASMRATMRILAGQMKEIKEQVKQPASKTDVKLCQNKLQEAGECFSKACDPRPAVSSCERAAQRIVYREPKVNLKPITRQLDLLSQQAEERHQELLGAIGQVRSDIQQHDEKVNGKLDALQQGQLELKKEFKKRPKGGKCAAAFGSLMGKSTSEAGEIMLAKSAAKCVESEGTNRKEIALGAIDGGADLIETDSLLLIDHDEGSGSSYTVVKWVVPPVAGALAGLGIAALAAPQESGVENGNAFFDDGAEWKGMALGLGTGLLTSVLWEALD